MEPLGTNSKGQKVWDTSNDQALVNSLQEVIDSSLSIDIRLRVGQKDKTSTTFNGDFIKEVIGWHHSEVAKEINAVLDEIEATLHTVTPIEDARNRLAEIRTRISKNNLTTESGKEG